MSTPSSRSPLPRALSAQNFAHLPDPQTRTLCVARHDAVSPPSAAAVALLPIHKQLDNLLMGLRVSEEKAENNIITHTPGPYRPSVSDRRLRRATSINGLSLKTSKVYREVFASRVYADILINYSQQQTPSPPHARVYIIIYNIDISHYHCFVVLPRTARECKASNNNNRSWRPRRYSTRRLIYSRIRFRRPRPTPPPA